MLKKFTLLCALLCAMAVLIPAGPARAEYVSANGSDANGCSETAPCATFQRAINEGAAEIHCLSSGDYGPVNIQASLIIDCGTGNVGNVSVFTSGARAITINTASAATIILRHLNVNGKNGALIGVDASFASGAVIIEDCTIQGFTGNSNGAGISFVPTAGRALLQVSDSRILNNFDGIDVTPLNNQIASLTLNRVEVTGNLNDGVELRGYVVAGGCATAWSPRMHATAYLPIHSRSISPSRSRAF